MNVLLAFLFVSIFLGVRSTGRRRSAPSRLPLLLLCAVVTASYLSQRAL